MVTGLVLGVDKLVNEYIVPKSSLLLLVVVV